MPGYRYHDATGKLNLMKLREYRIGLMFPDYARHKVESEEEFNTLFLGCDNIPKYGDILKIKSDLHFGYSSNPDFATFLKLKFDLETPFWLGYITHLVGDYVAYNTGAVNMGKFLNNCDQIGYKKTRQELHHDWSVIDNRLQKMYNIPLLPEVVALGKIKYETGETSYVNFGKLVQSIELIRKSKLERLLKYFHLN